MKKTLQLLIALMTLLPLTQCSKSDDGGDSPLAQQLVGEWHLERWNAQTPTDFDAYIRFQADKTFTIYQRIETVTYEKYSGRYTLQGTTLSGVYDDKTPWGSTYEISFNEQADILTMNSESSAGEVSVYSRTTIPEEIATGATAVAASRTLPVRIL